MSFAIWGLWSLKLLVSGLFLYRRLLRGRSAGSAAIPPTPELPTQFVTVQLPVYNEPDQILGLLQAVAELEWPADAWDIQILDDSTDNTTAIIADFIARRADQPGLPKIRHIRREKRTGYKAGALEFGRHQSHADLFAIFDCDFRPRRDCLQKLVGSFASNPSVAAVQIPWSYTNTSANLLTRFQTLLLNVHFWIEHWGRSERGLVFNFNGTAGAWRAEALEELGGWSDQSVGEDLLLSVRAYLNGWKIKLIKDYDCPSELPADIDSYLIQQRRWAKGSGQVLHLMGRDIWRGSKLTFRQRVDLLSHLMGYGICSVLVWGWVLTPFWITEVHQLINTYDFLSWQRLADLSIWAIFFSTTFALFGSVHVQRNVKSPFKRWACALLALMAAPFIIVLVSGAYWRGLLYGAKHKKDLVFNRTPKYSVMPSIRNTGDITTVICLAGFAGACSWLATLYTLWGAALFLAVQAILGVYFILQPHLPRAPWKVPPQQERVRYV